MPRLKWLGRLIGSHGKPRDDGFMTGEKLMNSLAFQSGLPRKSALGTSAVAA
jgi:hypothetical protein